MKRLENGTEMLLIGVPMGQRLEISREAVTREAREAARAGQGLNEACPYPFCSEAGKYFRSMHSQEMARIAREKGGQS